MPQFDCDIEIQAGLLQGGTKAAAVLFLVFYRKIFQKNIMKHLIRYEI